MNTPTPPNQGHSHSAPDATAIGQLLTQDITACQALLELMAAEREALQKRNADALGAIIEEKARYLVHLEQSANLRSNWAKQVQTATAESSWHELIESLRQPELSEQWQQLKNLMEECRQQNEINGKLLARSQHTFGRLLNIMRGQTESPSLYTQKGSKAGSGSSHRFGEA